jgi:tetratricopeptide (TPR) repeat protein
MKKFFAPPLLSIFLAACHPGVHPVVSQAMADTILSRTSLSSHEMVAAADFAFWKKRMDSLPDNFGNGPRYAAVLSGRFHMYGNICDLLQADSLIEKSNLANQGKEDGLLLTLASFSMLRHEFPKARLFVDEAREVGGRKYSTAMTAFDVAFESGDINTARSILASAFPQNNYAWYFRKSKLEHLEGTLDASISYMMQAAGKSQNSIYLRQTAYSNAADLCIHKGDMQQAASLFQQSVSLNPADFHSIMGLGWIALVHDDNDSLAEKLFQFVQAHTASPDVFLKLEAVAEKRHDLDAEKKWAMTFARLATNEAYGMMYNKYLIALYTGVLANPVLALRLAEKELTNRATPQTYAWYAWCLLQTGDKEKAYVIYKNYVSGKPLEGPELFYMGKLMQAMNKGYNAREFFNAAYKNRYDLSPTTAAELEKYMDQ